MPSGTVRGIFITMVERHPTEEVRGFWREHPVRLGDEPLSETETYAYLWEHKGDLPLYYLEEVNAALIDFLSRHGQSYLDFYNERHFRFEQGGMWSTLENMKWIKDYLPKLYSNPEPKLSLLYLLTRWGNRAVTGSISQLPYVRIGEESVQAVFSFAADERFEFRCPFLFSRSTMIGMHFFPKFFGLPAFGKTRILAECLHPREIIGDVPWDIQDGIFRIEGGPYGRMVRFSEWCRDREIDFAGTPVPDREVILIEKPYACPRRQGGELAAGSVYDAPIHMASIEFSRGMDPQQAVDPESYLDNILGGMNLGASEDWHKVKQRYLALTEAASGILAFEYRTASQSIFLNGRMVTCGVPAKILRKILLDFSSGLAEFEFRSFKYDPEIFLDFKRTSFETRWNRLRDRLAETTDLIGFEKTEKGRFAFRARCPVLLREVT